MNPFTIGALLAVAGGVCYAIFGNKTQAPLPMAQYGPSRSPGRAFIDHCDEMGREGAGLILARAMGQVEAEEFAAKFGKAAAKINAPAPAPAPAALAPPVPNP